MRLLDLRRLLILFLCLLVASTPLTSPPVEAAPMNLPVLETALAHRFLGDRSGACLAAAVIDGAGPSRPGKVSRAFLCADPGQGRPIDGRTAFEIGSVGKTMTGTLVAALIADGKLTLDDPLERHLPPGIVSPRHRGEPIRLRHLVTHTSGLTSLPSRMRDTRAENPYGDLTEADLLGSLADVKLTRAPGTVWDYSNFGFMLLSSLLARAAGQDFETLLARRLFIPLGMKQAYVARKPAGVIAAQGHLPNRKPTSAWDSAVNLAGAGDVRASLDDMVLYAQAALGFGDPATVAHIARSQQVVDLGPRGKAAQAPGTLMGMGWGTAIVNGTNVLCHEGGTGGFTASLAVDRQAARAVVLLADTAQDSLGGLQPLAFHLLGLFPALPGPRKVTPPPPDLLAALPGRYHFDEWDLGARLFVRAGKLYIHADGQDEFELGYDSHGDFFPLAFNAQMAPRRTRAGLTVEWTQGGGSVIATRLDVDGKALASKPPKPPAIRADDYRGRYPMAPGMILEITGRAGRLFVQGTGQPRLELFPVAKDLFIADVAGSEVTFERDVGGRVQAVRVLHAGYRFRGSRQ
jgi:serine-type D-Ala-D-Ala carboxypeptidase/endopeptidase